MVHFKITLFSSQDFEFFKTPTFVGSEFVLAIAVEEFPPTAGEQYRRIYLSCLEIPQKDRPIQQSEQQFDISPLCEDVEAQLPAEHKIAALFDTRRSVVEVCEWNHLRTFRLEGELPRNAEIARERATNFLLLKAKERALLAPDIPWQSEGIDEHRDVLRNKAARKYYNLTQPEVARAVGEIDRKKKILVHVCCGPDAAGVIGQLQEEFEVVCFWYDPNIQPRSEYDLRLSAFQKVVDLKNVESVIGEYDVDRFLSGIKGLEHTPEQGAKCTICYDMRLERAVLEAKEQNCDLFTTTLAISPHKVQAKLKKFGELLGEKHGIPYVARNFMKHEGFKESVRFTHDNDIYRQDYCGCWFSLYEGGPKAQQLATELGLTKENLVQKTFSIPSE